MACQIDLQTKFNEDGSGAIGFSFTGMNDEALTPNDFYWTLTDPDGTIVNSREDVSETPASTVWILLQGDDLGDIGISPVRILTIYGTYNTTLGGVPRTNLPYTGEYKFEICKLLNIT